MSSDLIEPSIDLIKLNQLKNNFDVITEMSKILMDILLLKQILSHLKVMSITMLLTFH
jgi:hypothetical protein